MSDTNERNSGSKQIFFETLGGYSAKASPISEKQASNTRKLSN